MKLKKFAEVEGNEKQTNVMLRKLDEMRHPVGSLLHFQAAPRQSVH